MSNVSAALPYEGEVDGTMKHLQWNKAVGPNELPLSFLKDSVATLIAVITQPFRKVHNHM